MYRAILLKQVNPPDSGETKGIAVWETFLRSTEFCRSETYDTQPARRGQFCIKGFGRIFTNFVVLHS